MNRSFEVLQMLIPQGGWTLHGEEYEGITFLECEPITKEQFELGFTQYDTWKAEQDATKAVEEATKAAAKQALLDKLGITEEEAQLLLGGN
jgi:hypothetical protein